MKQVQKQGGHVMSKWDYRKAQGKRGVFILAAGALWLATIAGIWLVGTCMFQIIVGVVHSDAEFIGFLPLTLPVFLMIVLATCFFGILAKHTTQKARTMQPLNYANTSELPAFDSLVRASQESAQAQQTILLRAAAETQDRHEEQLLRAVNEQE